MNADSLAKVIEQIERVQSDLDAREWDELIRNAQDDPHIEKGNRWYTGNSCMCHRCRPNRKYK